jgi:Holliday junction resolvase RusA-like endonuclease
MIDAGKHTASWRQDVAWMARSAYEGPLLDGALEVTYTFVMPRPKHHYRYTCY